ncbi:MAG: hypothetical protein ACT4P1_02815 [Sporichthyaceae bacterium]
MAVAWAASNLDSSVYDCEGRAEKDNVLLQRELVDRMPQALIAGVDAYVLCDSGDLGSFTVELKSSAPEAARVLETAGWERTSGSAEDHIQSLRKRAGGRVFEAHFEGTSIYALPRESALTSVLRLLAS